MKNYINSDKINKKLIDSIITIQNELKNPELSDEDRLIDSTVLRMLQWFQNTLVSEATENGVDLAHLESELGYYKRQFELYKNAYDENSVIIQQIFDLANKCLDKKRGGGL